MAFRTGSYVHKIGERLCPAHEQSESWTYIFPGLSRDDMPEILAKFHEAKVSRKRFRGLSPCAQRARARTGAGSANGWAIRQVAVEMKITWR